MHRWWKWSDSNNYGMKLNELCVIKTICRTNRVYVAISSYPRMAGQAATWSKRVLSMCVQGEPETAPRLQGMLGPPIPRLSQVLGGSSPHAHTQTSTHSHTHKLTHITTSHCWNFKVQDRMCNDNWTTYVR